MTKKVVKQHGEKMEQKLRHLSGAVYVSEEGKMSIPVMDAYEKEMERWEVYVAAEKRKIAKLGSGLERICARIGLGLHALRAEPSRPMIWFYP